MRRILIATIATLVLAGASQARAESLTYTVTVTGMGVLDGNAFNNQTITLAVTADTSNINSDPSDGFYSVTGTATVSVGATTDTFADPIMVYNQQGSVVGFQDIFDEDILDIFTNATSSYDLSTPFGPITDNASASLGEPFYTLSGTFGIGGLSGQATFTVFAPGSAVPEPPSLAMCGLAGLIGSAYAWRRRQRAAIA